MTFRPTIAVLILLLGVTAARADTSVKRLAPGVTLTQEIDKTPPLIINLLMVDLTAPGVHVGVGIGQDRISGTDATHGREDVSRYARRHGTLAAVNADYFPYTGDPLGVGITRGELFSEPWVGLTPGQGRVGLGLSADGRTATIETLGFLGDLQAADGARYFVSGINRPVGPGEIVAFTPLYGAAASVRAGGVLVTLANVNLPVRANKLIAGRIVSIDPAGTALRPIPAEGLVLSAGAGAGASFLLSHCRVGETVGFVLSVTPAGQTHDGVKIASLPRAPGDLPSREGASVARGAYLWANVENAVGGGPRLLANGQTLIDGASEGFDINFTDHPNPRTAVGVSRDGHRLLIVTVDGRQAISRGVTLAELAAIMKRYGAWNAMNFDGGGSTVMSVAGLTVSNPSGTGEERPVADMLTIDSDAPRFHQPSAAPGQNVVAVRSAPLLVGTVTPLSITSGDGRTVAGDNSSVLWQGSATGGIGFINQKGYFIAQKPGTGMAYALYRGQGYWVQLTVIAPAPLAPTFALHAEMTADPDGSPNRAQLFIRVLDKDNAPKANTPVHLVVTGGDADTADPHTDLDGGVRVGVTWNSARGGSVLILSPGLAPLTLLQKH